MCIFVFIISLLSSCGHRDRQTDGQTDRQRERERGGGGGERERERERERGTLTNAH